MGGIFIGLKGRKTTAGEILAGLDKRHDCLPRLPPSKSAQAFTPDPKNKKTPASRSFFNRVVF
jgi:hypothetical protein